jgi:DHA2 family multidrug resistance protein
MGEAALRMLDAEVNRQAAMVAYIDDFYLMMWMSLAVIPLTFFMTKADLRVKVVAPKDDAGDLPH